MNSIPNRREFIRAATVAGAGLALSKRLPGASSKSVLVFTKSSGFEHDVVKRNGGKPSLMDDTITDLGRKHGFEVGVTKDGRIFDTDKFHSYAAVVFFTTGDLTSLGTDGKPAMSAKGKQNLLGAIQKKGLGFVGVHAASDTFHPQPDPPDRSNRYVVHGEQQDPYLRMLGGEFIVHGGNPRLQDANLIVNDATFPGLEGVASPVSFNEEWYSLKDFTTDMHVVLTLDTHGMKGECYQRAPYPVTWARMHGRGRVFYTAMGDRPENWKNDFFLNLLGGGIRWAIGDVTAQLDTNLKQAAPGYAENKFHPRTEMKYRKCLRPKQSHRDRLIQARLNVPTGRVASVRKQGVDARCDSFGVLLVDLVAGLAALLWNCQDAQSLNRFEGICRFRVQHANTNGYVVAGISDRQYNCRSGKNTFGKNSRRDHAA
jgi:type 1 glutamine amidotransferase